MDIHNHWLRQEVSQEKIVVEYTPSGDMLVDGLTKALSYLLHQKFVRQLGLVERTEQVKTQLGIDG